MNKFQRGDVVKSKIRPFEKMIILEVREKLGNKLFTCRWFNQLEQKFIKDEFYSFELEGVENG